MIVNALETLKFKHSEVMYRINPVGSSFAEGDLQEVLASNVLPNGIVIPKVSELVLIGQRRQCKKIGGGGVNFLS